MSIAIGSRRYLTNFEYHRLPHLFTDTLVVGSGVAGLVAALEAAEGGEVLVVTKDTAEESATIYAQGGMAAAVSPDDSPERHAEDTIGVSCGLGHEDVIREVMREGPDCLNLLREWGTRFDLDEDGLALGREGGHKVARIVPRVRRRLGSRDDARAAGTCA